MLFLHLMNIICDVPSVLIIVIHFDIFTLHLPEIRNKHSLLRLNFMQKERIVLFVYFVTIKLEGEITN
jgi:hypothetical protein